GRPRDIAEPYSSRPVVPLADGCSRGHHRASGRGRRHQPLRGGSVRSGDGDCVGSINVPDSSAPPAAGREGRPAGVRATDQRLKRMVWVPGGTFRMGSADFYPEERPVHWVSVDGFWMDDHTVTVAEFRRFVKATGYVTVAEVAPDPSEYPGADPALL